MVKLKNYNYFKNTIKKFRLKNINETRNYFLAEIGKNKLMSYIEQIILHWTISFLPSAITGCILVFAFASLLGIPIVIASSAIGLKICAITTGIREYNSIIKKKKKK